MHFSWRLLLFSIIYVLFVLLGPIHTIQLLEIILSWESCSLDLPLSSVLSNVYLSQKPDREIYYPGSGRGGGRGGYRGGRGARPQKYSEQRNRRPSENEK